MNNAAKARLNAYVAELLQQAGDVLASKRRSEMGDAIAEVDNVRWAKFAAGCRNLCAQLGKAGDPFIEVFAPDNVNGWATSLEKMHGTLFAIQSAIAAGMIGRIEEMVFADALGDLLEQAEELLRKGYFLAAGVLGRAVLEEHLRKLCQAHGCVFTRERPTISDFAVELYKGQTLTLTAKKHVDVMADIGNNAAHNKPELRAEDVKRLIADLPGFLSSHPLA